MFQAPQRLRHGLGEVALHVARGQPRVAQVVVTLADEAPVAAVVRGQPDGQRDARRAGPPVLDYPGGPRREEPSRPPVPAREIARRLLVAALGDPCFRPSRSF